MPTEVVMPEVGESVVSGTVVKWLKKVGEHVSMDEPLVEVATDKANVEIPSPAEGVLKKIAAEEGEEVEVGGLLAVIAESEEEAVAQPEPERKPAPPKKEKAEAEQREEREEEAAAAKEPPEEKEKEKKAEPEEKPEKKEPAPAEEKKAESPEERRRRRSSPFVRSLARDYRIDLDKIEGSGIDGRVTKDDLLDYIAKMEKEREPAPPEEAEKEKAPPTKPRPGRPDDSEEVIPLEGMRKAIAEHMVRSKHTSPHVTTITEADMSAVTALRGQYKDAFREKHGVSLSYLAFIIDATNKALKEFPYLNSTLKDDKIILKKYYNIGVSVQTDRGLMTPVIKNADRLSVGGLARALDSLAQHAREGRLSLNEIQGGTFSITNPGFYGAVLSTPIINQPQAAILGVETIQKRVVVVDDAIAIRPMMYLCLSYDHRIVDGATSIQFLQKIRRVLEDGDFEVRLD